MTVYCWRVSPFQGLANAIASEVRNIEVKTNTVMQVACGTEGKLDFNTGTFPLVI